MSKRSVLSREFPLRCDPASVPTARRLVQGTLREWGLDALSDDASLATTELAANAVRHAGTDLLVTVLVADRLLISVGDGRPGHPHVAPNANSPDAESGRGLFITDALAEAWGSFPHGRGKTVWFTLALPVRGRAGRTHLEATHPAAGSTFAAALTTAKRLAPSEPRALAGAAVRRGTSPNA